MLVWVLFIAVVLVVSLNVCPVAITFGCLCFVWVSCVMLVMVLWVVGFVWCCMFWIRLFAVDCCSVLLLLFVGVLDGWLYLFTYCCAIGLWLC